MSKVAAALGALVLLGGIFITYINNEVIDPDAAGQRASEVLAEDAELRAAIAPQITDAAGDLPILGGIATESVEGALETPAAADAFGDAVANTVTDLTAENRPDPLTINLAQTATEAVTGLESTPLDLITSQVGSLQIDLEGVDRLLDVLDFAGELEAIGMPMIIVGLLLLLAALLLARGIWDGVLAVSLSIGVAACLGIAALIIGRTLLGAAFDNPETRDAVVATWDALGGDLMTMMIVGAIAGFVLAIGAALAGRGGRDGGSLPGNRRYPRDEADPYSREAQARVRTEPYRRPPPPPPPPDDLPPDQDFGRRRYS